MKRILMVALTVALALGLAATAYAGELVLEGKEAGMTISTTNGAFDQQINSNMAIGSFYVKAGTVTFQDGTFKFWVKDLQLTVDRSGDAADDDDGGEWTINNDYGKFYAETGGDGINFTLSNDKAKWLPYLGYLKPAASLDKKAKFLLTAGGEVAGVKVNANAYRSENDNVDMNLSAAYTMGDVTVDGFVGDYTDTSESENYDYYGGGITIANVFGDATLGGGVYANTGDGLAYVAGVSGVKAGNVTVDAKYSFGNANVKKLGDGEWKDSTVPGADTKEFYTKAVLPVDFFGHDSTITGEFTRYIADGTNKFKVTDEFSISDSIKGVKLTAELGSAVAAATYSVEATVLPGVDGLELYPKVVNKQGDDIEFRTAAQYVLGNATLRGGFIYKGGLDQFFAFGDSTATYGTLDTRVAGIYLKKNITSAAEVYTRGYLSATTDLNESLTGVGVKFLYKKDDTAAAQVTAAFGGNYAVSADTNLAVSYLFRDFETNHFFAELKKTVGDATFALSYGDNDDYKDGDDSAVDKPSHKEWIKKDNVPWRGINGNDSATQNKIKASVTVKF